MCTVTYLPTGDRSFLFTSNRDEAPSRAAGDIQSRQINGKRVLFPQDELAQGTWIAMSDAGQFVCILNGAFTVHKRNPPYRMSRGLMALQFFEYQNAEQFFQAFEFTGLEPFTFIIYDKGKLYDVHWDENDPNVRALAVNQSHIWSSSTLYEPERQQQREQWFAQWRAQNPAPTSEAILDFHRHGGEGDPAYNLVMNRFNLVCTTSITHLNGSGNQIAMQYQNLLRQTQERTVLPLQ